MTFSSSSSDHGMASKYSKHDIIPASNMIAADTYKYFTTTNSVRKKLKRDFTVPYTDDMNMV